MDFTTKELLKRYARLATWAAVCADFIEYFSYQRLRYALHALFFYRRTR
jgi:hypothetical protein